MNPASASGLLQCYWVVPGRLLAGEYPAHMDRPLIKERLDALLQAGIDSFFDLTEPGELRSYVPALEARAALLGRSVSHRRFPIPDFGLPAPDEMRRLLEALEAALAAGHNVYVHCWGGIGRTGMTVGCYLVHQGCSGEQALEQIASRRAALTGSRFRVRSPETDEQVEFVRRWSDGPGRPRA